METTGSFLCVQGLGRFVSGAACGESIGLV